MWNVLYVGVNDYAFALHSYNAEICCVNYREQRDFSI